MRVVGLMTEGDDGSDDKERGMVERGVGTGVVIIDKGTILTNLHVVSGAKRIKVTFSDGSRVRRRHHQRPARERPRRAARRARSPTT